MTTLTETNRKNQKPTRLKKIKKKEGKHKNI